jgi:DNA-binding CsgD family transcriptional regulator/tetratricopeptide (TPR) repeat protein
VVDRVDVGALPREDLGRLVVELTHGSTTSVDTVDELADRTGGNPFYLEELVAAGPLGGLPTSLAEVILGRVAELSEQAQAVLHRAAVLGQEVDDILLAQVSERPLEEVEAALHEAVAAQVLTLDAGGCRFRHALMTEALYDDLLPGAREALHQRAAEVLEDSDHDAEHVRWALLAHHWAGAREPAKAFVAAARAGKAAERVHAIADAATQYEQALALFDKVPDAQSLIGMDRAELLSTTSWLLSGSSMASRAPGLMRAAVDAVDADADPERRAELLLRLAALQWVHRNLRASDDPSAAPAAADDTYRQALALVEDRPRSRVQALALDHFAMDLVVCDRSEEAEPLLRRALEVASDVGADDVRAQALTTLSLVLVMRGAYEDGIASGRHALALGRHANSPESVVWQYANLAEVLRLASRYEEAIQVSRDGIEHANKAGLAAHGAPQLGGNLIGILVAAGRWDEADAVYSALPAVHQLAPLLMTEWLPLPLARGDLAAVGEHTDRAIQHAATEPSPTARAHALRCAMWCATAAGRWAEARAHVEQFLTVIDGPHDNFYAAEGLCEACRTQADRVLAQGGRDPGLEARLADRTSRFRTDWAGRMLPATPIWLDEADTHLARARGDDGPEQWAEVVEGWDRLGHPYDAARARVWLADATLRAGGSRDVAAEALRGSLATADRLGATPLADQARDLARRGRLPLSGSTATAPSHGLTPREREVLRLVAAGHTNREIGEQLFISDKTVSVHVTNLLRKLEVPTRRVAAETARRIGLT